MPIDFKLPLAPAGFAAEDIPAGKSGSVITRELLGPRDPNLLQRLEGIHASVFQHIPGFPHPSLVDHVVVLISRDLKGRAYVNELKFTAKVKVARALSVGEGIAADDILDVKSVECGVEWPEQEAVIILRSSQWARALLYDFGPIVPDFSSRTFQIQEVLALQTLLLLGRLPDASGSLTRTRLDSMKAGLCELDRLLTEKSEIEARYQELLEKHPWMLGLTYTSLDRHTQLDDKQIPDFTGVRVQDQARDIIEIKHPFQALFKKSGEFAATFNDAWNQAERYLEFVETHAHYLLEQKGLRFERPKCTLLIGDAFSQDQQRTVRQKRANRTAINLLTYSELRKQAQRVIDVIEQALQASEGVRQ